MHCGKIISVAISFLKNASLPGLSSHMFFFVRLTKKNINIIPQI